MATDGLLRGIQGFSSFQQQQLLNQARQQQLEQSTIATDRARADIALTDLIDKQIVALNPDTGKYSITEEGLDKFYSLSPETQKSLFNLDTELNTYATKYGKEKGEIDAPQIRTTGIEGKQLLPTSLEGASEEEKAAFAGNPVYFFPIKKKSGVFSILTRGRSDAAEDDQGIALSGSELGALIEARANRLDVLRNPEAARAQRTFAQQAGALSAQGTGQAGTTYDAIMDVYNSIDQDQQISGSEVQTQALGEVLGIIKQGFGATKQQRLDEANKNIAAPSQPVVEPMKPADATKVTFDEFFNMSAEEQRAVVKASPNYAASKLGVNKKLRDQLEQSGQVPLRRNQPPEIPQEEIENYRRLAGGRAASDEEIKEQIKRTNKKYQQPTIGLAEEVVSTEPEAPVQIDTSDFPDLAGIKTEAQALDLLNSGKLDNLITPDLLSQARSILEKEGVTDTPSFQKAVEEKRIQDPYVFSLIIANSIAGPSATQTQTAAIAQNLFNNIKTGDPTAGPRQLVADTAALFKNRTDFLKYYKDQSKDYKDNFTKVANDVDKQFDAAIKALSDEDANLEGLSQVALTSLDGLLGLLPPGSDRLRGLKIARPGTFKKVSSLIAGQIYKELEDSNLNIFTKDFWGDIPAPDDQNKFAQYMDRLAWRVDSEGNPVELVAVNYVGGGVKVESESSLPRSAVEAALGPNEFNFLLRTVSVLPTDT